MTALLSDVGILGGCLFIASLACLVILGCLAVSGDIRHRRQQNRYTATQPSRVTGAHERLACPWCDTHECTDSSLCNCGEPCGSWLCVVKEASRG